MNTNIRPFAEVCSLSKETLENLGFKFTSLHLDKTKEGWLRLYCHWQSGEKMEGRDKYPTLEMTTSESYACSQSFSFPIEFEDKEFDWKLKTEIILGIELENQNEFIDYTPKFHENLKYGVLVWFAPKNWNDGEGDEELFKWDEENKD